MKLETKEKIGSNAFALANSLGKLGKVAAFAAAILLAAGAFSALTSDIATNSASKERKKLYNERKNNK